MPVPEWTTVRVRLEIQNRHGTVELSLLVPDREIAKIRDAFLRDPSVCVKVTPARKRSNSKSRR